MTKNLSARTTVNKDRHPIDWLNPDYYDKEALHEEMLRVFDVCHGCRQCLNLCNSFPNLFDLIDDTEGMEVDEVATEDYKKVVDDCYLCDMCYSTKCPYVPPNPLGIDFPHLMLRAKATYLRKSSLPVSEKLLSSTDAIGKLAGIPVVTETINIVSQWEPVKQLNSRTLGIHENAWTPRLATKTFKQIKEPSAERVVVDGERTPGKIAVFATCYINYHEPGIGIDLLKVLEHNQIPWVTAEKEVCCGMPKLEQGDLEAVDRLKRVNIPHLAELARQGFAIMSPVPSCTLMFKQEIPLMYPRDEDVLAVKEAFWDPFEYLLARSEDGLIKLQFQRGLGKVAYHAPCHGRVQNIGNPTEVFLQLIAETEVQATKRCTGHAGTYGLKKASHEAAMKIGYPVSRAIHAQQPDFVSSDCPLGGHHIAQGIQEKFESTTNVQHPISLLAIAYGLRNPE
ncbi:MAG: Anaerobic glycerol-3-phosphate dehydrogenase subunit C [Gammaproteobacteria bacterium]|nr:MAG: Anaerobic glycerol-3-phosphate dehydrogenase subunit C [Gammaproteobacteria bacterium]